MTSREVSFVVTEEYRAWIENIKQKIRQSQIKASVKVNYAMLDLYWDIGRDIVIKQKTAKWGDSFLPAMSKDLKKIISEYVGFLLFRICKPNGYDRKIGKNAFRGDIISELFINAKAFRKHYSMCRKQWTTGGADRY